MIKDYDEAVKAVEYALIGTDVPSWSRNVVARNCVNAVLAYVAQNPMNKENSAQVNVTYIPGVKETSENNQ